jgi:hypothetical protein
MEKNIKFDILNVLPKYFYYVILILFFSSVFSLYLQYQNITPPIREEIGTTEPTKAAFQAFYIVVASGLIATLIFILFVKRKYFIIKFIFIYSFSIGVFILLFLFFNPLENLLEKIVYDKAFPIILIFVLFSSSLLLFGIFKAKNVYLQNHSLIVISCIFGSIIGGILEFVQLAIFLIALSLYDIFAVTIGPIGKIVDKIEKSNNNGNIIVKEYRFENSNYEITRGMFLELDKIEIGIGDIVLYSALLSNTVSIFPFKIFLATIGIVTGSLLTILLLLFKSSRMPGLPLPVFITLVLLYFL